MIPTLQTEEARRNCLCGSEKAQVQTSDHSIVFEIINVFYSAKKKEDIFSSFQILRVRMKRICGLKVAYPSTLVH